MKLIERVASYFGFVPAVKLEQAYQFIDRLGAEANAAGVPFFTDDAVVRGERFYRTVFLHGERISFTGNLVYCSSERGIIASGKTKNCFMVQNIVMRPKQ